VYDVGGELFGVGGGVLYHHAKHTIAIKQNDTPIGITISKVSLSCGGEVV